VYPGGEKEQMRTMVGKHRCWVNTRKGFCRLAVEFGIPVIPHYTFGENDLYGVSEVLLSTRMWICDVFHVALPIAFGRFGLPFPLGLPRKPPSGLVLCVGRPVRPQKQIDPKADPDGFSAAVDDLHGRYLAALREVFDENKAKCGYPDDEIELLPDVAKKRR
jgi:hypothetical protein